MVSMAMNETFKYYINDIESVQGRLDFLATQDLIAYWPDIVEQEFLYIGLVDGQKELAHKVAHNKQDITAYDVMSEDDIIEHDFQLKNVLTFEQAVDCDIVTIDFANNMIDYSDIKAREYLSKYQP